MPVDAPSSCTSRGAPPWMLLCKKSLMLTTKSGGSIEMLKNVLLAEKGKPSYLMNNLRCLETPILLGRTIPCLVEVALSNNLTLCTEKLCRNKDYRRWKVGWKWNQKRKEGWRWNNKDIILGKMIWNMKSVFRTVNTICMRCQIVIAIDQVSINLQPTSFPRYLRLLDAS